MADSVKQPEVAKGSHMALWVDLDSRKIRRNRCDFDFISLETKWPRYLG